MDIATLLLSFLGGGILGAVTQGVLQSRREKRERQIAFLERQLQDLYGPLFYLTRRAQILFEILSKFDNAYSKEYVSPTFSSNDNTQRGLDEETSKTIAITKKYISRVVANNAKIGDVLDRSYSLIDPDDIEVFLLFYEHFIRKDVETAEDGILETPFRIYRNIGDISLLPQEFIEAANRKFKEKRSRLRTWVE